MAEEKYTRCPSCRTVFRVTAGQLAMREGQVRCGHCRTLFDGIDCLVSLAPRPVEDDGAVDEADQGRATVTLRDYRDVEPPAAADSAENADREAEIAAELARVEEAEMRGQGEDAAQRERVAEAPAPAARRCPQRQTRRPGGSPRRCSGRRRRADGRAGRAGDAPLPRLAGRALSGRASGADRGVQAPGLRRAAATRDHGARHPDVRPAG
jgi:predicted Zn finger-like uncharacterized protein